MALGLRRLYPANVGVEGLRAVLGSPSAVSTYVGVEGCGSDDAAHATADFFLADELFQTYEKRLKDGATVTRPTPPKFEDKFK